MASTVALWLKLRRKPPLHETVRHLDFQGFMEADGVGVAWRLSRHIHAVCVCGDLAVAAFAKPVMRCIRYGVASLDGRGS
jgi:hypothetical protein